MTSDVIYENEAFDTRRRQQQEQQQQLQRSQLQQQHPEQEVYANQSTVDSMAAAAASSTAANSNNNHNNDSIVNKSNTPSSSSSSLITGHVESQKGPPPLPPPHPAANSTITTATTDGQVMSVQQQQLPQLLHWSEVIYECTDVPLEEWVIAGGSDYGQMPYLLDTGDILLELDGIQLAGLTRNDVLDIVRSKETHVMKAVSNTSSFGLPVDLREYLSRRFVRGSIDHDLQATIRDNVYMRTIPCTTRPPRNGELDNVDYKFISRDEFLLMEKSGILLESGIYSGHYYGTPLPLSQPATPTINGPSDPSLTSRFDRMTVSATEAGAGDQPLITVNNQSSTMGDPSLNDSKSSGQHSLTMAQKRRRNRSNIAAIDASSLPHGWEKISDAHYGVYYIDHINKRTQYERPYEIELTKGSNGFGFTLIELDRGLVVVKNILPGGPAAASGVIQPGDVLVSVSGVSVNGLLHSDIARLFSTFTVGDRVKLTFARGYQLPAEIMAPEEIEYEYFSILLEKGQSGFGFTIADGNAGQKVKKILDEDRCGSLRQGDILCLVNHIDLTPLTHSQVVDILKECPIGEPASITVKRKKRFRSKTPVSMFHSTTTTSFDPSFDAVTVKPPVRNCKTPSADMMMMRGDNEWMTNGNFTNGVKQPQVQYINTVTVNNRQPPSASTLIVNGVHNNSQLDENLNPTTDHYKPQVPPNAIQSPPSIPIQHQDSLNMSIDEPEPSLVTSPYFEPIPGVAGSENVSEDEYEYHRVELVKGENGFGFRIVGGAEDGRNVAVGSVVIGGVAFQDGTLKSGDEIISINDRNVTGAYHHQVVEVMSTCGPTASLLVRRRKYADAFDVVLTRQDNEGFGFVLISCGYACLIGRIIEDSPAHKCGRLRLRDHIIKVNDIDITHKTHAEIVQMIMESGSCLKLKIIPSDCYSVELMRGPRGFGFSIRGGAEFDGMPLFILRIAPDGPAFSLISVGDEIIEINNVTTAGMTHTEAVQMISNSGPLVKLKLRRNNPSTGMSSMGSLTTLQSNTANNLSQSATYSNLQMTRPLIASGGPGSYNTYPYSAPNLNGRNATTVNNNGYPVYP